ncbi:Metallo-dependent phosphatase-like protein [Mycena maculata]|uniref:Metallo-dependent phosphatase-like protein n=1 Tax=Mycena maculata TaxID=230809 RepID=A0AAD7JSD6_9AGAR|nr:Metallo-dependent phosphatase-like protein [Mycena maculata]
MKLTAWLSLGAISVASASQWPVGVPSQSQRISPPSRPLQWGDINVIATTDTHGWLLGHQKQSFPEPNYSGTWGDYAAFVNHMRELAVEKDVDLLLVDSGDLHDGTGLTDGFPPGGVDARDSNEFFKQIPYDVLAIGNHELYIYANTLDMHTNFAQHFKGRYLSSNVNITVFDANNQSVSVPVGSRFRKFQTRKGRSVTAFGILFDWTGNDVNTTIQTVEDMVEEPWFADAIADAPDVFLLVGHMPVARDRWPVVFEAIRKVHPTTPILIFGGHSHIRDCLQLDGRSMSLASGRYMETLGWMSVDLSSGGTDNLTFSRRYLDANRVTYQFHTNRADRTFDTPEGRNITQGLLELEERFGLTYQYGVAPQDYTMTRSPYPSNGSILTLIMEKAVPTVLALNTTRAGIPSIVITNSGSQRFDIYKGPFTRNDELTASPFVNTFLYIPDVPFAAATAVLPALNDAGAERLWPGEGEAVEESRQERVWRQERAVEAGYAAWLADMHQRYHTQPSAAAQELTPGYVTSDACPGLGDDTPHAPLPAYRLPDFIASPTPAPTEAVDLVFVDFMEAQLIRTLNEVQTERVYSLADAGVYSPVLTNEVLGIYAQVAWN